MPKGIPKKYTAEFKKRVIEAMLQEHLSYGETARMFELTGQIGEHVAVYPCGRHAENRGDEPQIRDKIEYNLNGADFE